MSENNLDRKDLKIQALLEKISQLTTNYENQVADLRVSLTVSEQTVRELQETINNIHLEPEPSEPPPDDYVVEGKVVEDVPVEENPATD